MVKEVDHQVLAVIDEMRLSGPRLTPVEIVAKMGVFDARDKPFEHAWLATGDNVIATVWAEFVSVGEGGRWFCLESLDVQRRAGGGPRSPQQVQRAKDRLGLLKQTWGENAIGNVGIGAAFGLIMFLVIAAGVGLSFVAAQVSVGLAIAVGAVFLVAVLLLGVYQAALSGIYSAALYRYAESGEASVGFDQALLQQAFATKKK